MKQLLEHTHQFGPILGLLICFSVFVLVLLHIVSDRRHQHLSKMRSMALDDVDKKRE